MTLKEARVLVWSRIYADASTIDLNEMISRGMSDKDTERIERVHHDALVVLEGHLARAGRAARKREKP